MSWHGNSPGHSRAARGLKSGSHAPKFKATYKNGYEVKPTDAKLKKFKTEIENKVDWSNIQEELWSKEWVEEHDSSGDTTGNSFRSIYIPHQDVPDFDDDVYGHYYEVLRKTFADYGFDLSKDNGGYRVTEITNYRIEMDKRIKPGFSPKITLKYDQGTKVITCKEKNEEKEIEKLRATGYKGHIQRWKDGRLVGLKSVKMDNPYRTVYDEDNPTFNNELEVTQERNGDEILFISQKNNPVIGKGMKLSYKDALHLKNKL